MIHAVRPHVGGRGDAVAHVVEARDRGDVPDVALAEARLAQRLAICLLDRPGLGGELGREIEHGALALAQPRGAIVHHHQFAQRRIAGQRAHRGAMRHQAVVAAVHRRHRDRDHLALELGQARRRQHQVVVHADEGFELGVVEGVGRQHVGHEAELLLALGEIGLHRRRKLAALQRKRGDLAVVLRGLPLGRRDGAGLACFALILLGFFRFIATSLSRKMLTEAYNPSAAGRNHYSPAGRD